MLSENPTLRQGKRRRLIGSRHVRQPGARAFTLIELLVVIAIVALLISILIPSLLTAREQAKSTKCLSNLKDLGAAAHAYATHDPGNRLVPVHSKAVRTVFEDWGSFAGIPGGTAGAYVVGDIEWGGKGGDPRLFNADTGREFGNRWAFTQAFGFGPGDRPLNQLIYGSVHNTPSEELPDLNAALEDNRLDLPAFRCPSDVGWEWHRTAVTYMTDYVVMGRGFKPGDSHFEFTGNSYKTPMAWLIASSEPHRPLYSSTIFNLPGSQVHKPSRLIMMQEANADDTYYFNRPEIAPRLGLNLVQIADWWVQGWHQLGADIMEFNVNFADGHAARISQKVRSGFRGSDWRDNELTFSNRVAIRGSRPETIVPSWSPQNGYTGALGYWGDKMYRGDGWMIDNAPAPVHRVTQADP